METRSPAEVRTSALKRSPLRDCHAVIIGGGGTGAALAHDFTLRGGRVTLLERGELTSGSTGRHHGLLHSGARYVTHDPDVGRECVEEVNILRRIASESLELNWGLFVALTEEDMLYRPRLMDACAEAGIPVRAVDAKEALEMVPRLNPATHGAALVPDGTIDAWRLPLQFFSTAKRNGAIIRAFTPVIAIETTMGRVDAVLARDLRTGKESRIAADLVINAAGAWAGDVASLCGLDLPIRPCPGSMLAVSGRLTNMTLNRLHPPGEGDIIVPQRRLSIVGATQWESDGGGENDEGLETCVAPERDIELLLAAGNLLIPGFSNAPFHAAWASVRPLSGSVVGKSATGQGLSRNFSVIDHADDGVNGMFSIIGGKATTIRAMAEKTIDTIVDSLEVAAPCETANTSLLSHRSFYR